MTISTAVEETSPVTKAINYLVECGWKNEEAQNLIRAIKSDKSAEDLWDVTPKWIEHCGESMKYVHAMLGVVALGLVTVRMGEDGEWLFALNENGLKVGEKHMQISALTPEGI